MANTAAQDLTAAQAANAQIVADLAQYGPLLVAPAIGNTYTILVLAPNTPAGWTTSTATLASAVGSVTVPPTT